MGGCVRDALLGVRPDDWDVTTNATPDEMRQIFKTRAIPTGLKHGTMTIRSGADTGIEVTTYRLDGDYTDHRRPDCVTFTDSLKEDLRRRDFTINAIALNLRGELYDPYHGQDDLKAGILRCVENPDRRFQEDALRIMRGLRFAAVLSRPAADISNDISDAVLSNPAADSSDDISDALSKSADKIILNNNFHNLDKNADILETQSAISEDKNINNKSFKIAPETADAIRRNRDLLLHIAPERIWTELYKLTGGEYAVPVLRQFPDVIGVFWPEILPMIDFDQKNKHHCYDVWEHTLHALDALNDFETPFRQDIILKFALLLHDIGKPATCTTAPDGQRHFYGHPAKSREIAEIMLKRLKTPNIFRERVLNLIEQHDRPIPATEREIRRLLTKLDPEDTKRLFDLKRADNLAQSPAYRERQAQLDQAVILLRDVLERDDCFSLKQLAVNGHDMQKLGLRGPEIGDMLKILLERVINGDLINHHDILINFARDSIHPPR